MPGKLPKRGPAGECSVLTQAAWLPGRGWSGVPLRGWLGLPSDFLAQGTRHRCRKPCVHLHQFETRPRPWSAVRGVIRRFLLGGLRPSGRGHVTSPSSARPLMRLTHVNMKRSRHIIQLSVFPRPAGVHSGRLASKGAPALVMPSSTRSYISAVTLLLQCTLGNAVLAQEGQATTTTASANDRGDACAQSIEKVINLCMMRGLNNIGRVNCDCVQDGRKWTCTGAANCAK